MEEKKQTRSVKVLERDIQREILDWLDDKRDHLMFWRQNNGAVFGKNNAGKMTFRAKPKYSPNGVPDIWVVMRGILIGFEVKRPGKKATPEQVEFGSLLIYNGGYYYVVSSLQEVKDILHRT